MDGGARRFGAGQGYDSRDDSLGDRRRDRYHCFYDGEGAEALRRIKDVGGVTIAQARVTAKAPDPRVR
jgi:hypothetical protein